jgi:hypothetical protein
MEKGEQMNMGFDQAYGNWLTTQIAEEKNPRRLEMLRKGLSHGTVTFLRMIWFPVIGHFNDLHPEYEVRDFNNRYRYLDLAYMPGGAKGCIEIQDYGSHARDIEPGRFKDLCLKQSLLTLDDWDVLPVAYLSIRDDPGICKQLVLSFVGKYLSSNAPAGLHWAEAETVRFARRLMRDFEPRELAAHLMLSENRTRVVLRTLAAKNLLVVASGKQRYRTYRLSGNL